MTSGKFLEALGSGIGTGSIFCLSFSLSNRVFNHRNNQEFIHFRQTHIQAQHQKDWFGSRKKKGQEALKASQRPLRLTRRSKPRDRTEDEGCVTIKCYRKARCDRFHQGDMKIERVRPD